MAKRTLNAAAVIGSQFDAELPAILVGETALPQLIQAELIDQIRFTPKAEYVFRHPLIRTVAYESQLKSDRAALHRRLATEIEQQDPGFGRREGSPDRRASRSGGRSTCGVRLAYACRNVGGRPRHRRGAHKLAQGPRGRGQLAGGRP